ncbi:MAG: HipA domain-containing protein, partial [Kiritimatiellae bacterium]|nr:HipA domain-containing protein [Kiritimatiellia bacterium]
MEPIDFTDCERLPGRAYNGANGKKIAVRYDDDVWLLKFPPSTAEKPTTLSYSNSCYSEHLASTIANMIGLKAQETRLGTFTNGKTKVVCACRDFTADVKVLYDFCSIKNTVIDSDTGGTGTEMNDVLETIELQSFVDPVELKAHFWDMFVVDAFLGNFDRHNGNWGFLVDPATRKAEIAPAY